MTRRLRCLLLLALAACFARGALAQAPSANAATGYREAMSRLAVNAGEAEVLKVAAAQGRRPSAADLKLLEANRSALELMESSSHLPLCDFALAYVHGVAMKLDHLEGSRTLSRLACLRACQGISEHDWKTAANYLAACFRFGRHLAHDRTNLSTLVQAAIFRDACRYLIQVFEDESPPAEFRGPIAEACREARVDFGACLPFERWETALALKWIARNSGGRACREVGGPEIAALLTRGAPFSPSDLKAAAKASGCPEARLLAMADPADFKAYVIEGAPKLDALMAEACREWARGGPAFQAHLKTQEEQFTREYPGSVKLLPALSDSWERQQQVNSMLARCVMLLALGDYVDRTHSLPANLRELESACGSPLPKDPLTGGNLGFRVDGLRARFWVNLEDEQANPDHPATSILFHPIGNTIATWTVGGLWLAAWGIALTMLLASPSLGLRGNPMFAKEIRVRGWIRVLLALGGAGCIVCAVAGVLEPIFGWSREVWDMTFVVLLALCFFGAPPLVIACFAEERDRGTGEGLVLTSFPRERLLLGKLAAWLLPVAAPALAFTLLCGPWSWTKAGFAATPVGARGWTDWASYALVPVTLLALTVGFSLRFGAPRRTLAGGMVAAALGACLGAVLLVLPLALVYRWNPMDAAGAVRVLAVMTVQFIAAVLFAAASFRRAVLRLEESWSSNS